jgi:hypothetical protein
VVAFGARWRSGAFLSLHPSRTVAQWTLFLLLSREHAQVVARLGPLDAMLDATWDKRVGAQQKKEIRQKKRCEWDEIVTAYTANDHPTVDSQILRGDIERDRCQRLSTCLDDDGGATRPAPSRFIMSSSRDKDLAIQLHGDHHSSNTWHLRRQGHSQQHGVYLRIVAGHAREVANNKSQCCAPVNRE